LATTAAPRTPRALARPVSRPFFFPSCYRARRHLHSFPTRRSSDLGRRPRKAGSRCRKGEPTCAAPFASSAPNSSKTDVSSSSTRSEEHTSELQSRENLVCRLLLEKKNSDSGRETVQPTPGAPRPSA